MIRLGTGAPLVLLHGVLGSSGMWRSVVPLLADRFDVAAPTALGHRGGRAIGTGPADLHAVVDDAERTLDELGFERPHLAGNSMGGWMALELARRGRAASVTAFSPAGCWDEAEKIKHRAVGLLQGVRSQARRFRPVLPLTLGLPAVRRYSVRGVAVHGDRLSPADILELTDDLLQCEGADQFLATKEGLAPLEELPCPVTIAWCEQDRVLPMRTCLPPARTRVPGATFVSLPDVGHVPMLDNPALVAQTIVRTVQQVHPVS